METGQSYLLKAFSLSVPTRIVYGVGVSKQVVDEVHWCGGKKAFLVTDPGIVQAGLVRPIVDLLQQHRIPLKVFDEVEVNPRAETVNRAAHMAQKEGIDVILAVGGGSSLDAAKGIAVVVSHGGTVHDYEVFEKPIHPVTPMIAIPTTAGTGSEVTAGAVITDTKRRVKMTVGKPHLAPAVALVDPELTLTLPPAITAATGIDALTHAIEAYIDRRANPFSDALSLCAIELISLYLRRAVRRGQDLEARGGMMLASLFAGISFANAGVAGVHCMAEALGGLFDVPHGVANAIFLPYVMGYNRPEVAERTARIGYAMGVDKARFPDFDEASRQAVRLVCDLVRELEIPKLRDTDIHSEDIAPLAVQAHQNTGTPFNVREIGEEDYLELFRKAFHEEDPL